LKRKLKRECVEACLNCKKFVDCDDIGKFVECVDFEVEGEVWVIKRIQLDRCNFKLTIDCFRVQRFIQKVY